VSAVPLCPLCEIKKEEMLFYGGLGYALNRGHGIK
jgi:hypothetical protein